MKKLALILCVITTQSWAQIIQRAPPYIAPVTIAGIDYIIDFSPAELNGGFETAGSPFGSWDVYGDGGATMVDTSAAHGGTHAVSMYRPAAGSNNCLVYQTVLTDAVNYTCKLWAYSTVAGQSFYVLIGIGGANLVTTTDTYALYTITGACSGDLILRLSANPGFRVIIDDVRLYVTP